MISPQVVQNFTEIDKLATERANKGGARPDEWVGPVVASAVGVFILLGVFTTLIGLPLDAVVLPRIGLTVALAGGVFASIKLRQNSWFRRYHEAFQEIEHQRNRGH